MIVGHVYCKVLFHLCTSMKINSFSCCDLKYYFILRSPKSAAYVVFTISFMGYTLILVSVHNILSVSLPCLFGEVKLCEAGPLVLEWVRPFRI